MKKIILQDLDYEYSKIELVIELNEKTILDDIYQFKLSVKFKLGSNYPEIIHNIIWSNLDIEKLYEQINSINLDVLGEQFGDITVYEPEFQIGYIMHPHVDNGIILFITLDNGSANADISTETGPTLKMVTTIENLLVWVEEIKGIFLDN